MASPVVHRPTVETRPRPPAAYLGFDNSSQLREYRLARVAQLRAKKQSQQVRTYKQLVRALNSALATQTKTTRKSSMAKSQTRNKPS